MLGKKVWGLGFVTTFLFVVFVGILTRNIFGKSVLKVIEDYLNKVGYSERTDAVIEPKLSMQWFCKMEDLAKPALDHVMNDDVQFLLLVHELVLPLILLLLQNDLIL